MRILEVHGLGYKAVIVDLDTEQLLLIESGLSTDERISAMNEVMAQT